MTQPNVTTELLPCPFCGELPEIKQGYWHPLPTRKIECCVVSVERGFNNDKEKLIAEMYVTNTWNRRFTLDDEDGVTS